MGDEAVDGSKLGTKLIMFVAIIALALVAFLVGKSLINTGVDEMETSAKNINDSQFSDYDSKIVRGRVVKSAIDTFNNQEYAIVVCTLSSAEATDAAALSKETAVSGSTSGNVVKVIGSSMTTKNGKTSLKGGAWGVNYNAILEQESKDKTWTELTITDGVASYEKDFALDEAGNVKYFLSTSNMSKKGQTEYVADSSSFYANLIKNASGDIMGIVFTQRVLQ